jgi:hypothetical protein
MITQMDPFSKQENSRKSTGYEKCTKITHNFNENKVYTFNIDSIIICRRQIST